MEDFDTQEKRTYFTALVESTDCPIISIGKDLDGTIRTWNRGAERSYGYSAEEAIGKNISILLPPGHPDDISDILSRLKRGESVENHEAERVRKDGGLVYVSLNVSPIRDREGVIIGGSVIAVDITARKRAEEALRKSKELGDALNRINALIFSMSDTDSIMHRVIEEAAKAAGADSAVIYVPEGKHWLAKYVYGFPGHEGTRLSEKEIPVSMLALKEKRPVLVNEFTGGEAACPIFLKKHGAKSALDAPLLIKEDLLGDMALYSCSSTDVFDEQHLDFIEKVGSSVVLAVQNAGLLAQLKEANKELERFSYSVSHDLRAPLRLVSYSADIIMQDHAAELSEPVMTLVNRIRSHAQRMNELILSLLSLFQVNRQEIRISRIDMESLAWRVYKELMQVSDRNVKFSVRSIPPAYGDRVLIPQVFTNLIGNALKFTREREVAEIEVGSSTEGTENVYYVKDNGTGFDMKYAKNLFDPFQRLHSDKEFQGAGIGLSIVERIVSRHNGRVWVKAEPGKGATFFFTLHVSR